MLSLRIHIGDEEHYKKYSHEFFNGNDDLNERLKFLVLEGAKEKNDSPKFSLGYAMYVYIKAFFMFEKDKPENQNIVDKLIHLKTTVGELSERGATLIKDHPWEIIFKYSAMLEKYGSEKARATLSNGENKKAAKKTVGDHPEYIIDKVLKYGDIEYFSQDLNTEWKVKTYERKVNALWMELYKEGKIQAEKPDQVSFDVKEDNLKRLFSYMYH